MTFALHPTLAQDCIDLGQLSLCRVLLMNNSQFPWLILVPQREDLRELYDLAGADYITLTQELHHCSKAFSLLVKAQKINVAALGNMVPQLHVHIIARYKNDPAWPNPVWNSGCVTKHYAPDDLAKITSGIRTNLGIS